MGPAAPAGCHLVSPADCAHTSTQGGAAGAERLILRGLDTLHHTGTQPNHHGPRPANPAPPSQHTAPAPPPPAAAPPRAAPAGAARASPVALPPCTARRAQQARCLLWLAARQGVQAMLHIKKTRPPAPRPLHPWSHPGSASGAPRQQTVHNPKAANCTRRRPPPHCPGQSSPPEVPARPPTHLALAAANESWPPPITSMPRGTNSVSSSRLFPSSRRARFSSSCLSLQGGGRGVGGGWDGDEVCRACGPGMGWGGDVCE